MLLDTGAEITIIKSPVPQARIEPAQGVVRGITGETLRTEGEQVVELDVDGVVIPHRVTVANIGMLGDGLLGVDVLRKLGAIVDLGRGEIKVPRRGENLPCRENVVASLRGRRENADQDWIEYMLSATRAIIRMREIGGNGDVSADDAKFEVKKVPLSNVQFSQEGNGEVSDGNDRSFPLYTVRVASRKVVVPAYSEVLLRGKVQGALEGKEVLIEPISLDQQGLRVSRAVDRVEKRRARVTVINGTNGELRLDRGAVIGHAQIVDQGSVLSSGNRDVSGVLLPPSSSVKTRLIERLGHLSDKERAHIEPLLMSVLDVFDEPGPEGCSLSVEHRIETGDARPIAKRPYRVPFHERNIVNKHLDEMLSKGIIRPSDSPWSAPVVLVKKKGREGDVKYRFCTDFRALNSITRVDVYPLPLIQETLEQLGTSRYFSTVDLKSGYHQIPIAPEHREKTAFTTVGGHYEYNRLAFGLAGGPATFQRVMDQLLMGLKGAGCYVYLDDVVVYSSTIEEHADRLRDLFSRLQQANLKVNLDKCRFCEKEVTYLGHLVTRNGVRPDPEKLEAVLSFPRPRNVREVRGFLGLAGYYRRFIREFAEIARPLTQLTGKGAKFEWRSEQEAAFTKLRKALCSDSVLIYPDFRDPFILATDASNAALGAVLSQVRGGSERPIAYSSRQLRGPELNYSATEKELLAVVWATKQYRCYLLGRKFKLITDHAALRWLLSLRDPSSRLTRWSLRLAEFDYDVEHKPGKKHSNADALSRQVALVGTDQCVWSREKLRQAQESDPWCLQMVEKELGNAVIKDADGILYWKKGPRGQDDWRLMVPQEMRAQVIERSHSSRWAGHPGIERTTELIRISYYWPCLERDVREFVQKCHACAKRKSPVGLKAPLEAPFMATFPFEQISIDIMGPLPRSKHGNKYLLTMIDHFTRYAEGEAISEITAEETARVLVEKIITRHGVPKRLLTDQGRNFVSRLFKETCKLLGICKVQTTPYHPEANGMVERLHRTLTDSISHFVRRDGTDWDRWVPYALMAYRSIPHSSTGYSPNFLMYGRELTSPAECWERPERRIGCPELPPDQVERLRDRLRVAHETARRQAEKSWAARTKYCNKNRNRREFQVGDWVYLHVPAIKPGHSQKFHCPWTGPHRISRVLSRVTYELTLATGGTSVVHVNRIKRAMGEGKDQPKNEVKPNREGPEIPEGPIEDEEEIICLGGPYFSEDEEEEAERGVVDSPSETLRPEFGTESSDSLPDTTLIWVPDSPEKDSPTVGRREDPRPLERARELFLEGRRLSRERQREEHRDYTTFSQSSDPSLISNSPQDTTWCPDRPLRKPPPRSPYSLRSRHKDNNLGCSRVDADRADEGSGDKPHG